MNVRSMALRKFSSNSPRSRKKVSASRFIRLHWEKNDTCHMDMSQLGIKVFLLSVVYGLSGLNDGSFLEGYSSLCKDSAVQGRAGGECDSRCAQYNALNVGLVPDCD